MEFRLFSKRNGYWTNFEPDGFSPDRRDAQIFTRSEVENYLKNGGSPYKTLEELCKEGNDTSLEPIEELKTYVPTKRRIKI